MDYVFWQPLSAYVRITLGKVDNCIMNSAKKIRGIAVCNPVDVQKEYLLYTIDYAIEKGLNHIQYVGPIHDGIKGNIDGMTLYRKYDSFNGDKDVEYVKKSMDALNEACERACGHDIEIYVWHHELELPYDFQDTYPEIKNSYGDIEITHPIVRDFLENKILDFFAAYPKVSGIILTLHETKIPLLKLKEQKLDKTERVKYITEILYNTCKNIGKELIVRPFASLEKDYEIMMRAYESISEDLIVMDKWTQFDWSLTLPHNRFYEKIKKNPLLVETDIFGEYFGKGKLPLMLKNHIEEKYAYCESHQPIGYCSRIDRNDHHSFGDVNEVNLRIMEACQAGEDVDKAIDDFFEKKYPGVSDEIREIMENTEEIQTKIMYLNEYYFSELSLFPSLNHCKNHYYFEIMKENGIIVSDEWYIPLDWEKPSADFLIKEKESAIVMAQESLDKLVLLKGSIDDAEFDKLLVKFKNLKYVAQTWYYLTLIIYYYAKYFETKHEKYISYFEDSINELLKIDSVGKEELGDMFYCINGNSGIKTEFIKLFADEVKQSFIAERKAFEEFEKDSSLVDYIVCGGGAEGHKLQKEVNFSDTKILDGSLFRVPGSLRGAQWCSVNAHGWFSYELKVIPGKCNVIKFTVGNVDSNIDLKVTVNGNKEFIFHEKSDKAEFTIEFVAAEDVESIRIKFDKISQYIPCIYNIRVY